MYENLFKNPLNRVFVYGTLKRGEPNHRLLQNQTNDGYAKFLGVGRTVNKYPLVIATKYNIPFLLKKPDTGNQVFGEIYDVDTRMLEKLDELEDHPRFYVRTEEEVLMAPAADLKCDINFEEIGIHTKAWTYFLPKFNAALLEKEMYVSYSNEGAHGLKYTESDGNSAKPEDVA